MSRKKFYEQKKVFSHRDLEDLLAFHGNGDMMKKFVESYMSLLAVHEKASTLVQCWREGNQTQAMGSLRMALVGLGKPI